MVAAEDMVVVRRRKGVVAVKVEQRCCLNGRGWCELVGNGGDGGCCGLRVEMVRRRVAG